MNRSSLSSVPQAGRQDNGKPAQRFTGRFSDVSDCLAVVSGRVAGFTLVGRHYFGYYQSTASFATYLTINGPAAGFNMKLKAETLSENRQGA